MNPSAQKHNIARARVIAERTQKEFAGMIDCPLPTLQAVELGKLQLPDEVGLRASLELDVPFEWLQQNDLNTPVLTRYGEPYERVHFIYAQREKSNGSYPDSRFFPGEHYGGLLAAFGRIFRVCSHLSERRADYIQIVLARLRRFVAELEEDFGPSSGSKTSGKVKNWAAMQTLCDATREVNHETAIEAFVKGHSERRGFALNYLREQSEGVKASDVPRLIRDLRNEVAADYAAWQKQYIRETAERQRKELELLKAALKKSAEERRKAVLEEAEIKKNPALHFYQKALRAAAENATPDEQAA